MTRKPFSENNDFIIRAVRNGQGIVTKRPFVAEEPLFEVRGALVECNEDDVMDETTRANTYRYTERYYLSPQGRIGDFLNHSCNPNAKVVQRGKRLWVVALRAIPAGREVLIDYSTITAADDVWKMTCHCGSAQCRGRIGRFASLPRSVRDKYIARGIVPAYILAIA